MNTHQPFIESEDIEGAENTKIFDAQCETHAFQERDGSLTIKQIIPGTNQESTVAIAPAYIRAFIAKLTEIADKAGISE